MNQYGPNQIPQYAPKKDGASLPISYEPIHYICLSLLPYLPFFYFFGFSPNDILEGHRYFIVILISAGYWVFYGTSGRGVRGRTAKNGSVKNNSFIRSGKDIKLSRLKFAW